MAVNLVCAIEGLRLNARRPDALAEFFVAALGFGRIGEGVAAGGVPVELKQVNGAAYPASVPGWSPLFQHFAIVTTDMARSYERLCGVRGWTAISRGGPATLPQASGGVTAFKFRDPEGHPLELIALPGADPFGIDHSALSVSDTRRSIAFYNALGFQVRGGTYNHGKEQDQLDGLSGARVDVTALAPPGWAKPHLELLAYRGDYARVGAAAVEDIAATRLVLRVASLNDLVLIRQKFKRQSIQSATTSGILLLRDPDGHLLEIRATSGRR